MKLENWRREIDLIDEQLIELFNRRAKIAREIGAIKADAGLPVVDAARENEILLKAARNKGVLKREAIIRIFRAVIRESRNVQTEMPAPAACREKPC
ncbi:MAG TPA: chorismate mutase [Pyrinomonadaceae bacterium]